MSHSNRSMTHTLIAAASALTLLSALCLQGCEIGPPEAYEGIDEEDYYFDQYDEQTGELKLSNAKASQKKGEGKGEKSKDPSSPTTYEDPGTDVPWYSDAETPARSQSQDDETDEPASKGDEDADEAGLDAKAYGAANPSAYREPGTDVPWYGGDSQGVENGSND